MQDISSLIVSVAANVISHYICKWLDGCFSGRKHKIKKTPFWSWHSRRGVSFRIGETYAVSSLYFHYMLSCEKVKHIKKSHSPRCSSR